MLKHLFTTLYFVVFISRAYCQHGFCGQAELTERLFQQHPEWRSQFYQHQLNKEKPPTPNKPTDITSSPEAEPEIIIPVVFHILHEGGVENISDAQVEDEIRILNRDYQKQNADTAIVVEPFKSLIANIGMRFKLARKDPNGNCTNGIVRHVTPKKNWDANNLNAFEFSWPRNKYLNIYVVKTINIAATAYAFLPGTPVPASADAIVTLHNMVGSIGTGSVANSRVLTHEVGHWFGLQHIWGTSNQPGVVCGDDLVEDTPETKGFTTCATNNTGICNPGIPENVQNYMDYAPCKIMFTLGQKDRILSFATGTLNGRNNVYSQANLEATGIAGEVYACLPSVDFESSARKRCTNSAIQFSSVVDAGPGTATLQWTFQGGTPATSTNSQVAVAYASPGTYAVTLTATSEFGAGVETKTGYIKIEDGTSSTAAPYAFDFETDNLLSDLQLDNMNPGSETWFQNAGEGANGTAKCFMLSHFGDINNIQGEKDAFELPYLNLTDIENLGFSYYYAYSRLTAAQRDSFKVQYSLDCGGNWQTFAGLPSTTQMAVASGGITPEEFFPTQSQWVQQVVPSASLSAIAGQNGVKIRFLFVKDINKTTTNNVYVDQIQLTGLVANAAQIQGKPFHIYPNPSEGSFYVTLNPENGVRANAQLFDMQGRMLEGSVAKTDAGDVIINRDKGLSKGVYNLILELNGQPFPNRLVVN